MSEDEINKAITAYFNKDTTNIPEAIIKIGLVVSYDMGWQKRSAGNIYDSLSQVMHISLAPSLAKSSASWSSPKAAPSVKLEIG